MSWALEVEPLLLADEVLLLPFPFLGADTWLVLDELPECQVSMLSQVGLEFKK